MERPTNDSSQTHQTQKNNLGARDTRSRLRRFISSLKPHDNSSPQPDTRTIARRKTQGGRTLRIVRTLIDEHYEGP